MTQATTVFEHILIGLDLMQMNKTGRRAQLTPPCHDLPTLVHMREGGSKRKPLSDSVRASIALNSTKNSGNTKFTSW